MIPTIWVGSYDDMWKSRSSSPSSIWPVASAFQTVTVTASPKHRRQDKPPQSLKVLELLIKTCQVICFWWAQAVPRRCCLLKWCSWRPSKSACLNLEPITLRGPLFGSSSGHVSHPCQEPVKLPGLLPQALSHIIIKGCQTALFTTSRTQHQLLNPSAWQASQSFTLAAGPSPDLRLGTRKPVLPTQSRKSHLHKPIG